METSRAKRPQRLRLLLALLVLCGLAGAAVMGMRYRRAQWLESASIEELAKAATANENDIEVFLRLAGRAKDQDNWPRAARAYEHACQLAPDRVEAWVGWARSMYEIAGFAAADAILNEFLRRHPTDVVAYIERAALRRNAQRNDKAWNDINQALKLRPQEGKAWALRGDLCIDMGTYQDARTSFQNAKKYLPDSHWPLMGLYHANIEMKDLPEAEASARELRERFPNIIEGRIYLGEVLLAGAKEEKQIAEAVQVLEEAEALILRLPADSSLRPSIYLLLGRAYYTKKDYPKARLQLEKSIQATPDNPDALFYLGRTYRALGLAEKAEKTLAEHRLVLQDVSYVRKKNALLKTNPDDFVTRLELARWYRKREAYRSALNHYEELVERGQGGDVAKAELEEIYAKLRGGSPAAGGGTDAKAP